MSINNETKFWLDQREAGHINCSEQDLIDDVFDMLCTNCAITGLAKDDRVAELEAALIKFIVTCRS